MLIAYELPTRFTPKNLFLHAFAEAIGLAEQFDDVGVILIRLEAGEGSGRKCGWNTNAIGVLSQHITQGQKRVPFERR